MSTVLTFDLSLLYNKNSYILVNVFGLINRIIKLDIRDILVYLYQCILLQLILGHVRWILKESSDQAKSVLDNLKLGRFVDLPPSVKFYQNLTVNSLGRARLASLIKANTNFCAYQLFLALSPAKRLSQGIFGFEKLLWNTRSSEKILSRSFSRKMKVDVSETPQ